MSEEKTFFSKICYKAFEGISAPNWTTVQRPVKNVMLKIFFFLFPPNIYHTCNSIAYLLFKTGFSFFFDTKKVFVGIHFQLYFLFSWEYGKFITRKSSHFLSFYFIMKYRWQFFISLHIEQLQEKNCWYTKMANIGTFSYIFIHYIIHIVYIAV